MRCSRCRQGTPPGAKFCPQCGAQRALICPDCGTANSRARKLCLKCRHPLKVSAPRRRLGQRPGGVEIARLTQELQARHRDLAEALEQQTATREILRAISSSAADLPSVLEAILESAMRLCDAHLGSVGLHGSEGYRHVVHRGASPEYRKWVFRGPHQPDPSTGVGRMIREQRPVHIPDLT